MAPTTEIEGNLLVRSPPNYDVGGNVHITGPCSDDGCRESGTFNVTIDGESFSVHSAGPISLHSADSDGSNDSGADISLKSGDGVNPNATRSGKLLCIFMKSFLPSSSCC